MNILILGNGFDLSLGLPTTYGNLLNILSEAKTTNILWNEDKAFIQGYYDEKEKRDYLLFCNTIGKNLTKEFIKLAKESFWVTHFLMVREKIGERWLDFEKEIERVIKSLLNDKSASKDGIQGIISNRAFNKWRKDYLAESTSLTFDTIFELLVEDLNMRLIRIMDIYMDAYIGSLEPSNPNPLGERKFDKLLSFNYSQSYVNNSRILDDVNPNNDICYIHGKADVKNLSGDGKLVLGFDDLYLDYVKTVPEEVPFKKFYQRIIKNTDNNYVKWINEIDSLNKKGKEIIVTIFGHSLAPSDGDVLKRFISFENAEIHIYCKDNQDKAEKLINLAIILGPQKLIELSGPTPAIKWIMTG